MEENSLKRMIERFFDAGLSIEEERELCRYLRENDVPAELRKDKEAIIALCDEDMEMELPAGAEARLEAMLDTLAENERQCLANECGVSMAKRRILKVPRFVWSGAVAAVVLAVAYLFAGDDEQLPMQHTSQIAAVEVVPCEQEEDTFDNPEDAMKCFKSAMNDIQLAFNTTEKTTHEIGNSLNEAFRPYKDIIRINM